MNRLADWWMGTVVHWLQVYDMSLVGWLRGALPVWIVVACVAGYLAQSERVRRLRVDDDEFFPSQWVLGVGLVAAALWWPLAMALMVVVPAGALLCVPAWVLVRGPRWCGRVLYDFAHRRRGVL